MNVELIVRCVSLLASTFAISGINFDHFIKKEHVWEARFLAILMILGLSFVSSEFLISLLKK